MHPGTRARCCTGVFNEPLSDLTKVLATLVDGSNRICIPGFLDRVRPNTLAPALARLDSSAEFSLKGYRDALGVPQLVRRSPRAHARLPGGLPGAARGASRASDASRECVQQVHAASTSELLRARWCEPALSVVDVRLAGDQGNDLDTDPFYRFGPTRFSVIPHAVVGNVSVRFVLDQVGSRPLGVWPGRSRRLAWTQVRPLESVWWLHRTRTSS